MATSSKIKFVAETLAYAGILISPFLTPMDVLGAVMTFVVATVVILATAKVQS